MTGYANPVIPGFHPDPSVCRVGDEYYLATSTFTWFPGVPIFRSRNLVDWELIGHALHHPDQLDLAITAGWGSLGVYAPTLRHHDGRFWMITTNVTNQGARTIIVTAEDPAGPWSDPVHLEVPAIDPDLAWDADGNCWLHCSAWILDGTTTSAVVRYRVDPTTGELLSEQHITWSGTGLQFPEAPHLYERDGTWYLMIAEGGTHRGHAVSIARGPGPEGPWEPCPANPIVSHRSTDRPVQNTGHADLVQAVDGSWWMVLLGVRPRGGGDGFHTLGRETFLVPVEWHDGWPVVGEVALSVDRRPPGTGAGDGSSWTGRDDFDATAFDLEWIGLRRGPAEIASLTDRPGWCTVRSTGADLDGDFPDLVARRQQHPWCRARTRVDAGGSAEAGIAVYLDTRAHARVAVTADRIVARAVSGSFDQVLGEAPRPGREVTLVVATRPGIHGPDAVVFGFEDDAGAVVELGQVDGRYYTTEVVGGFTGRVIGMYTLGGDAAFDWFDYEATDGS